MVFGLFWAGIGCRFCQCSENSSCSSFWSEIGHVFLRHVLKYFVITCTFCDKGCGICNCLLKAGPLKRVTGS